MSCFNSQSANSPTNKSGTDYSEMVARHRAALETHLGATLINRTTRRQQLTEIGRSYYERCRVVQVELTLSDRIVDPVEEDFEVIIRIGDLTDSTMTAWLLSPYRLIACALPWYVAQQGMPLDFSEGG